MNQIEKETALKQVKFLRGIVKEYKDLIEGKYTPDFDEFWMESRLVHEDDSVRFLNQEDWKMAENSVATLEMCISGDYEKSLEEDEIARNKYSA